MRITVGHLIILVGVGSVFALKGGESTQWIKSQAMGAVNGTKKLVGLIVDSERPVPPAPPAESASPEAQPEAMPQENQKGPGEMEQPVASSSAPAAAPAAVKQTPAKKPAVRKKQRANKKRANRRKARRKQVAAKQKTINQASAAKKNEKKPTSTQYAKLIGTYVEIELKTGRSVKGVLREASRKELTVELPGLGPFKYPSTNIKTVKTAE